MISALFASCGLFRHAKQSSNSNTNINTAINAAKTYLGTPYKLGGTSKAGIDCSALVQISFEKANVKLPRRSVEQSNVGKEVKLENVHNGDLVFFKFDKQAKNKIDHVGIITDASHTDAIKFIHASTKLGVTEDDLSKPYNKKCFVKCMRVCE
jgi:probable lipoprotein NlpC